MGSCSKELEAFLRKVPEGLSLTQHSATASQAVSRSSVRRAEIDATCFDAIGEELRLRRLVKDPSIVALIATGATRSVPLLCEMLHHTTALLPRLL
eukprot:scaffold2461_cov160-Pinguiococcus_pyrenoidosus.AAC.1